MKKNINKLLIFFLLLLLLSLLLLNNNKIKEPISEKIELFNWWAENDYKAKDIFNNLFDDIDIDRVKMYSVFGEPSVSKNKSEITVQYSGESNFNDPNLFDINFIPTDEKNKNIIIFPHAYYHLLVADLDINTFTKSRSYEKDPSKKFCLFSVSNGSCNERNTMFTQLNKYKKVDSCGKFMNNMGKNCPAGHGDKEYFDFISKYKFMICFENTSKPNYFTEKLINAYYSGTIPIYWGCTNISDYVNMDSILYLPSKFSEDDMEKIIEKIKYLDNNEKAYKLMYEQPFFKNGKIPREFNISEIKSKIKLAIS